MNKTGCCTGESIPEMPGVFDIFFYNKLVTHKIMCD